MTLNAGLLQAFAALVASIRSGSATELATLLQLCQRALTCADRLVASCGELPSWRGEGVQLLAQSAPYVLRFYLKKSSVPWVQSASFLSALVSRAAEASALRGEVGAEAADAAAQAVSHLASAASELCTSSSGACLADGRVTSQQELKAMALAWNQLGVMAGQELVRSRSRSPYMLRLDVEKIQRSRLLVSTSIGIRSSSATGCFAVPTPSFPASPGPRGGR